MVSFKSYLLTTKIHRTPVGDFVRDVRSDPDDFPEVTSWPQVHRYLLARNACPECIHAARAAWRNYQRWKPYGQMRAAYRASRASANIPKS